MLPLPERRAVRRNRLFLLGVWLLFYGSFTLFSPPLLDDADSVHAEVAREMLLRHDFVTLHANGIRYLEKAPLFYWMMAGAMKLFGATAAASRLPLAFSVLGLTLLLEAFARRAVGEPGEEEAGPGGARAGLYAGLIMLSSFGIFIFTRINIPDVLVCALLTGALFCFLVSEQQARPTLGVSCGFAGFLALTLLTKGMIGIVFPVLIVVVHLLLTRGWGGMLRRLAGFHPVASTVTLLLIAAPWHVLAALANPGHGHPLPLTHASGHWEVPYPTDGNVHGWAWFYFVNEQLYRYLNLRVPHDYDTVPLYLFVGLVLVWLMPWSAFLPVAVARALPAGRRLRTQSLWPGERTNLLLLLWAAIPLLFFTFSTRQEYYVLPSLPPLMLLIGRVLSERPGERSGERSGGAPGRPAGVALRRASAVLLGAGVVLSAATVVFLLKTRAPAAHTDLASLLGQNPGDYALSFGHFLDLNAQALGLFRLPLALTAAALLLGPLANFALRRREQPHAATLALAAAALLFLFAAWLGLRTFSPTLTSAELAELIRPQLRAEDLIVLHGEYEAGSTLGFYLRRDDLHIVEGRSSNLWYGSFFPDAPRIFDTPEEMVRMWKGPRRIFLWQDPHDPERPALQLPAPVYVVGDSGGKQILSNRPGG